MEKKIYSSKYVDYYIDEENNYIVQVWKNKDGTMTEEDFKKAMLDSNPIILQYKPSRSLVDAREMEFIIHPDLQVWIDKEINAVANAYLKKVAFIIPEDLFIHASIEQTNQEEESTKYGAIRHFKSKEEALEWLLGD